jgi:hypothetical protein
MHSLAQVGRLLSRRIALLHPRRLRTPTTLPQRRARATQRPAERLATPGLAVARTPSPRAGRRTMAAVEPGMAVSKRPAWSLGALRAHVRQNFAAKEEVLRLVLSIDRSSRIFLYHMTSARDAMNTVMPSDGSMSQDEMMLTLLGTSARQDDYEWAKIVNEAHLIGCLHTTRGVLDIFAQLVNSTVLSSQLRLEKCDIARVTQLLPHCALRNRLEILLSSHWCKYVSAFINTTKHRQLVAHTTTVSFVEDRSGIKLGAFKYGGQVFPAYWDEEVLQGSIEVSNGIVDCGRLLNSHLGIPS